MAPWFDPAFLPQVAAARSRRAVIAGLGAAALAWPAALRAQPGRVPRLGMLMNIAENDPSATDHVGNVTHELRNLGWSVGSNLEVDCRWGAGDRDLIEHAARDLVRSAPDILLAHTGRTLAALRRATQSIPIVFVLVDDPAGAGFVDSLAHPGGNATGFTGADYPMTGKWVETLHEIAPRLTRVALVGNPDTVAYDAYWRSFEPVARARKLAPQPLRVRDPSEFDPALASVAGAPGGGLIVLPDGFAEVHREVLVGAAQRYRLPVIYPHRSFTLSGGLLSDGIDGREVLRRSAFYIDRILRGARPADLPVQQPAKFELIVNLRAARAIGLPVPPSLLATADSVID